MYMTTKKQHIIAMLATLMMVVVVRELSVLLCRQIGFETAGNIVGLIIMFILLVIWRQQRGWKNGLPFWLTHSSNIWLKDSGFAFLPISAGAGLLLFSLGDDFWQILSVIVISTFLPLWAFAHLAERWLNTDD